MEQFITVEFAAVLLMVCEETVRRWIRRGRLPAFRAGARGRYRIPLSALQPAQAIMLRGLEGKQRNGGQESGPDSPRE